MFLVSLGLTGQSLLEGHALYVAFLQVAIYVAVALSVAVAIDRVFHVAQFVWYTRVARTKPEKRFAKPDLPDPATQSEKYPTVVVVLPCFNESAVIQSVIHRCAELRWPASRLSIQVLE